MGDDAVKPLARDMLEREFGACLDRVRVAPFLAERRSLELGEISEPPNAYGAGRLGAGVDDDVGRLPVVPVKNEGSGHLMFFQKADAAHGLRMQELLVGRHHLAADAVMALGPMIGHCFCPPALWGD